MENSVWQIGNGKRNNLQKENLFGQPLVSLLQILEEKHHNLKSMLSDIIHNNCIVMLNKLAQLHPDLSLMVVDLLPNVTLEEKLRWYSNDSGLLNSKFAFKHCKGHSQVSDWGKLIWCSFIPPSNSLVFWRLSLAKFPTDDKLALKGFCMTSICIICANGEENMDHLFLLQVCQIYLELVRANA